MTRKLSGRCQKMDWQKVIFEETGEKFATHCKIWKSALARFEVSQSDSVSILSTISNRSVESEARLNERSILDYFFEEEIEETGKSSEKISTIRDNEVKLAQEGFQINKYKSFMLPHAAPRCFGVENLLESTSDLKKGKRAQREST